MVRRDVIGVGLVIALATGCSSLPTKTSESSTSTPSSSSTPSTTLTAIQQWVSSYGPNLKAIVEDLTTLLADSGATSNAILLQQCRSLTADTTYMEGNVPAMPIDSLQSQLSGILQALAQDGIACQAGAAGDSSINATNVGLSLGAELTSLGNLADAIKANGADMSSPSIGVQHQLG